MSTPEPRSSACVTSPLRPGRYRWFVRLCAAAVALAVLSTALLQATPSAIRGFGGIVTLTCLAGSFAIWQAAQVFLCSSGREIAARHVKETAALNALYVVALTAAVSLFFLFPTRP